MRIFRSAVVSTLILSGCVSLSVASAATSKSKDSHPAISKMNAITGSGSLSALSCVTSTWCIAVGQDGKNQPLVIMGNPKTWTAAQAREITLSSNFGSSNRITGVTCSSTTFCVAVGLDGNGQPFVLTGNPSKWTTAQAREFAFDSSFGPWAYFLSVTCSSPTTCLAVGKDANGQPLVLSGNPATWTAAQATEITLGYSTFGGNGELLGANCRSVTACVAVGIPLNGPPLVLLGNPSTWTAASATVSSLAAGVGLTSVACSSVTSCVAVGFNNGKLFVLRTNSTTSTGAQVTEITLGSKFANFGLLSSVTCSSAIACVAVGRDGKNQPLVLSGNPANWTAAQAKEITLKFNIGARFSINSVVACSSATACVVVGTDGNSQPFVITGNPATWTAAQAKEITLGSKFG